MSRELLIYLGDPVHNFILGRDIWTVPLNICDIASYVQSFFDGRVRFRLFKFPDLLIKAIEEEPCDILGLSNYIWNSQLSRHIAKFVKTLHGDIVTVMGGPNATQTREWMTEFMRECSLDYYISLYGEHPFKCLVEAMFRKKFDRRTLYKDNVVEGVWYIDELSGCAFEKPIRYKIDYLNKIPSAYSNGFVDEFLDQDLIPMIETHRGCPFLCTYCDWGSAGLKKITQYSVKRVKEDIEYCRVRSRDERLMIDDANFGILGQRDLEIAEYLKNLRQDTGYPGKLIMTWSQAKSPVVLKIAGALSNMLMVTTSFQSMNEDVLRNIKRKNIPHEQFSKIVDFSEKEE